MDDVDVAAVEVVVASFVVVVAAAAADDDVVVIVVVCAADFVDNDADNIVSTLRVRQKQLKQTSLSQKSLHLPTM